MWCCSVLRHHHHVVVVVRLMMMVLACLLVPLLLLTASCCCFCDCVTPLHGATLCCLWCAVAALLCALAPRCCRLYILQRVFARCCCLPFLCSFATSQLPSACACCLLSCSLLLLVAAIVQRVLHKGWLLAAYCLAFELVTAIYE